MKINHLKQARRFGNVSAVSYIVDTSRRDHGNDLMNVLLSPPLLKKEVTICNRYYGNSGCTTHRPE